MERRCGGVSELAQEGALKASGPLGYVGSNPTTATKDFCELADDVNWVT